MTDTAYNKKSGGEYRAPYESASQTRRTFMWRAPASGPNATVASSHEALRHRARESNRNNAWVGNALEQLVIDEVGWGIAPQSKAADEKLEKQIEALWWASQNELDPAGILNFAAIQAQAALARRADGEVFIRRRYRRIGTQRVPVQIQILEADYVPTNHNVVRSNGNRIINGIEFNKRGQRVAYWMYREHPGEWHSWMIVHDSRLIRVPARDVIHHYRPTRPGQVRGVTGTHRSLLAARDIDHYADAELQRKKNRSAVSGVIERDVRIMDYAGGGDEVSGEPTDGIDSDSVNDDDDLGTNVHQYDDEPIIGAGLIAELATGEKFTELNADTTGGGYADYQWRALMQVAAGMGIPYEVMTGDWSKAQNDRMVRNILQQYRRGIESSQWLYTVPQVCQKIWQWWFESAVIAGEIPTNANPAVEWAPQRWPYIHPTQDVSAEAKAVEAGFKSRDEVIRSRGYDPRTVDEEQAAGERRRGNDNNGTSNDKR